MGERFVVTDGGTHHHMAAVGVGGYVRRNFPLTVLSAHHGSHEHGYEYTITGALCTPNDVLGKRVRLPTRVQPGDLIGVGRSGAYGPTASPGLFLSHGFPVELLVHKGEPRVIRVRDKPEDLLERQRLIDLSAVGPL